MATKRSRDTRPARRRTAGVALAAGLALSACTAAGTASDPDSAKATALAAQFNERLAEAGLRHVDPSVATALYGADGGVSCENVAELQQLLALSQFGNNAVHLRRVVLDPNLFAYDLAVVETYCPDKAASLLAEIQDLDTEETIPTYSPSPSD